MQQLLIPLLWLYCCQSEQTDIVINIYILLGFDIDLGFV